MAVPQFSNIQYKKDPKRVRIDICTFTDNINQETPNDWLGYVKCRGGIIEGACHSYWVRDWMSEWVWMRSTIEHELCTMEQKLCYSYGAQIVLRLRSTNCATVLRSTWRIPNAGNPSMGLTPLNCPPLVSQSSCFYKLPLLACCHNNKVSPVWWQ